MRRTTPKQQQEEHHCIGHREGDWVIFICPVCKDYQRHVNTVTKEVKVRKGNTQAVHVGNHSAFVTSSSCFSIN